MRRKTACIAILLPLLVGTLLSGEAMALQVHTGSEGLVVHQLAHVQYLGALGYLLWDLRRSTFVGVGWLYLQCFCWLMMVWNVLAFFGHFAQVELPHEAIVKTEGHLLSQLLPPFTFSRLFFYIAALDHLLCAPALFFLYLAMRSFYRSLENPSGEGQR